jgi:hypothetical protein
LAPTFLSERQFYGLKAKKGSIACSILRAVQTAAMVTPIPMSAGKTEFDLASVSVNAVPLRYQA